MDQIVDIWVDKIKGVLHVEAHSAVENPHVECQEQASKQLEFRVDRASVRPLHLVVPELLVEAEMGPLGAVDALDGREWSPETIPTKKHWMGFIKHSQPLRAWQFYTFWILVWIFQSHCQGYV